MKKRSSCPLFLCAKVFVFCACFSFITYYVHCGVHVKKEEIEMFIAALHERGLNHEEAVKVVNEAIREAHLVKNLSKKKDTSLLVKVGLLLIAFPDPTISDLVGALLVSAGLIQTKIKRSELHMEDVHNTLHGVMKDLQTMRRELG